MRPGLECSLSEGLVRTLFSEKTTRLCSSRVPGLPSITIQGQLVLVLHSIPFISSSYSVELQTEPKALVTLGKLMANKLQRPHPFCQGLPFIFQCYYSCPTPEFLHRELPVPRDSKHEPSVWPMPG